MNVFNKLKNAVGKSDKNLSAFDEIIGKERNIELGDINKLKVNDLVDIVKKYDQFVIKMRKETQPIMEQHEELSEKVNILENNLRGKMQEYDEINSQLLELQKLLNNELSKNIQLQQHYEFATKQNEHLKQKLEQALANGGGSATLINSKQQNGENGEEEQTEQKTNIQLNADSELLMFTNEQELQHLRNLLDQLKDDTDIFVQQLIQEKKDITDKEQKKRENRKAEKEAQKQNKQSNEDGDNEEQNGEEEEQEEEEYTLEELCGNTWDSFSQFNEQMTQLLQNMKDYKQKRDISQNNNKDLVNNYETQILSKQKQVDQIYMEKEKIADLKKQLENDFIDISQKLTEEKTRNALLEDKLASFSKQFQELYNENEQLLGQLKQTKEEKNSISQEIGNVQNIYAQEEQKQKEEIESLQKELEEIDIENEQLKEELQKAREDLYLKVKELDNKDRQEKLKIAQSTKDIQKLEQKLAEAQTDLEKQIEQNHQTLSRIKVLEEKRIQEKNKMKGLKDKVKELQEELNKKKLENAKDLEAKNKMLDNLEEEIQNMKQKSNIKEELSKLTLERDVKITNLEIQLQENCNQVKIWNEKVKELEEQIEELKKKNLTQEKNYKILSEKRELGLQEIQKLNAQIELMKSHSNPVTIKRMNEIQNLVERASTVSQSGHALTEAGSNTNKFSNNFRFNTESDKTPKQFNNDFTSVLKAQQGYKPNNTQTNPSSQSLSKISVSEINYLNQMKKEMESVYKDYIQIAFSYEKNTPQANMEQFMKLEKKINLTIKKAQDLMDALEDTL